MTEVEKERLIETWISYQRTWNIDLSWTVHVFDKLTENEPWEAWDAIQNIYKRINGDPEMVSFLAAGPLEDLLTYNGELVFNSIKDFTNLNVDFKECIKGVWQNRMTIEFYSRVQFLAL